MKKIIKGIGILTLVMGMLFLSNLGNEKNNKGEFTLVSLLNVANAQIEYPWPEEPEDPPSGEIEAPYTEMCPVWMDYAGEPVFYGNWPKQGMGCDWVVVPETCTPYDPC